MNWPFIAPIALLCISNVFMTFAWYGQLKFPHTALWVLIPVSWSIAFFEYCFAVPANHFGSRVYTPVQLKTMQEVITLIVFAGFSVLYLGDTPEMEPRRRLRLAGRRLLLRLQKILTRDQRPTQGRRRPFLPPPALATLSRESARREPGLGASGRVT